MINKINPNFEKWHPRISSPQKGASIGSNESNCTGGRTEDFAQGQLRFLKKKRHQARYLGKGGGVPERNFKVTNTERINLLYFFFF